MPRPRDHDRAHHHPPRRDSHGDREFRHGHGHGHGQAHTHTHTVSPSRSRSPGPRHRHASSTTRHRRSASPESRAQRPHHRRHRAKSREPNQKPRAAVVSLPFSARRLGKADLDTFEPLFAYYLEVQKQKELATMEEREVRGRWKSFAGKWNRGELAEGWYDPDMFAKCALEYEPLGRWDGRDGGRRGSGASGTTGRDADEEREATNHRGDAARVYSEEDFSLDGGVCDDDDDYGPSLPGDNKKPRVRQTARSATRQDLSLRDELLQEDRDAQRQEMRQARLQDRALQKDQLEELVPRAEAGTRERALEKKKLVNEKMRHFRDKSPPGMEVGEAQLMGGGDSVEDYKKMREKEKGRKSERQIRREEFERAKMEEMEHRRKLWKEREEGTVEMLKELARQRFG
ncbi:hypothetical protein E4U17_002159 [Claviceps sp. LM77 group G4]|nr:hypothetical protein E4U17_002159 [Claviceps sp. LM77 group G4]KAG6074431.1 hypothetical protein E4U33_002520 [Claviceps sp. LM78 group G4]KAG6082042.1 hypothetical protein E4U16_006650 [Claviceps sp. LM84 group G4]